MENAFHTDDDGDDMQPVGVPSKPVSELGDVALYQTLKTWFLQDDAHSADWRENARMEYDFVAGDQWIDQTVKANQDENRVPLSFNYTLSFIKAVAGLEIGTRHEVSFLPRVIEEGDIVANEVVGATSKWMGDGCDAEDEQSEAFLDTTQVGMGWTDSRWDFETERDGKYLEEQLDPLEMRWDRSAKKKNLADSRRMWRVRSMTLDEAKTLFPDADEADLNASWAIGFDVADKTKSVEERRLKLENSVPHDPKSEVHIVQCQWWERQPYYRVAFQDREEELDEKTFQRLRADAEDAGVKLTFVKQYKKVFKQAFLGASILEKGDCPDPERFTLQCITGQLHKTKRTWFGLTRLMMDPQRNANKWLSQALHILNTTAKGGIIAERGAFKSITEAQKTYGRPDAITIVENGAISGNKIMQKPGAGLASPYVQLVEFAIKAIPAVTGINLELLGIVDRNQPGILEAQRKQAGMTILATLFDALKKYRKVNGQTRLYFIQNYVPDNRIIRVTGPEGMKAIRFIRDQHLGEYDVVVDSAPTSANQKEATWGIIMQMSQLDTFKALMTPEVAAEVLNYAPLPSKIVALLKKGLTQPKPDEQQAKVIAISKAIEDLKSTKAKTLKDEASAGLDRAKTIMTLADAGVKQAQAETERMNQRAAGPQFGPFAPASEEPFAVQPMDNGGPALPQLPHLPTSPRQTGMEDLADMFVDQPAVNQ